MDKSLRIIRKGDYALVYTPFNEEFLPKIRALHGFWDYEQQCWWIKASNIPAVRIAMREVFGTDDTNGTDTTTVWLTFSESKGAFKSDYILLGKILSHATSRNSGGSPGKDVHYLHGKPESGGSVKNWSSVVPAGSVVRLTNVSWHLLDNTELPPDIRIDFFSNQPVDQEALLAERELLIDRINEIDKLLAM